MEKITTQDIADALLRFFHDDYNSLILGIKKLDETISINKEQNMELLVLPIFATIISVNSVFGNSQTTKDILDKFHDDLMSKYFRDEEERNKFNDLYYKRYKEYSEILRIETKDTPMLFGKSFSNNFFNEIEDGKHLFILVFVRGALSSEMVTRKEFLDEISSKFKIV